MDYMFKIQMWSDVFMDKKTLYFLYLCKEEILSLIKEKWVISFWREWGWAVKHLADLDWGSLWVDCRAQGWDSFREGVAPFEVFHVFLLKHLDFAREVVT